MKKIKKAHPVHSSHVIVTMDRYTEDEVKSKGGLIMSDLLNAPKEFQTVLEVPEGYTNLKPGDTVYIDLRPYMQFGKVTEREHGGNSGIDREKTVQTGWNFTWVEYEGEPAVLVSVTHCLYVVDEWSEEDSEVLEAETGTTPETSNLVTPETNLYIPPEKKIIKPV